MATGGSGMLKWENMFDQKNDFGEGDRVHIPDIPEDDDYQPKGKKEGAAKGGAKGKRLSVERIYQKKSQLEHILLRPDTYIGSAEKVTQNMWVLNEESNNMEHREVTYVPGLYKIFDEIMVNAADNKQRDAKMNLIKIDIDPENCKIKIWNNGKGIPIAMHQTEKMYVPTLIFGVLLTSSNYEDDQKKVTGGRNGYGAKLCNIFSTKFVVETQCNEYKKAFRQTWTNNMGKTSEPKITDSRGEDYTCITFYPDLSKFKMESLDKDIVDIFTRRAYDIAAACKGVKVMLNGKRIAIKGFKDYCDLYLRDKNESFGESSTPKLVYEAVSDRWEVGVALSERGYQQASFVNSIATTKGGRHVDYITDQVVSKIIEVVKKREKKGGLNIKPFQVKSHIWIFVNCLIENPAFDSQTKENMTTQMKNFGSKCPLSDKFIGQLTKSGIVEAVQTWMKFKATAAMDKKSGSKTSKLKNVQKLDDANDAGTKHSMDCTLILTEGDSAKSLAVAGLQIVGRDRYGVFPLKGKVLNVREASHKQIMENAEITNLLKIVGLRYKEKYETPESMKTLRYGKVMIMTDQDQDGSHIKGLLINFVHHNWPNLLRHGFLEEFITPIVKVKKSNLEKSFYSIPEFEEWKNETPNWHTYKIKYYKGLGTSTAKEAKEYFSDMERHKIGFNYKGTEDDASILLAFSKKKIEDRKEWLTNWMEERKRRQQLGLPELYLYSKETKAVSFSEFVNRELILFSNMDNERSIPCLVDGLKPGQRKVMFTCFKRKLFKELKVAQLAGSVAELSAYHHGEASLMGTIVNLAQNFVGSNNINLLQPIGQFGTRLHGGKDAASPRYIFTCLSPLARILFDQKDDMLLKQLRDDNQLIEPEWYCPIIPMVLVNGAQGIGTGWSTNIPNYDPREIVRNIRRMLEGRSPEPMMPSFKNFRGTIEQVDGSRYVVNGEAGITQSNGVEITELPVRTWTQSYKENVLEPMLQGSDKVPAYISDYKEYHTDTTVKFVIKLSAEKLDAAEESGVHKVFKLQTSINTSSMVLFDASGCIRRYDDVLDILREFYTVRLDYYQRRKDCLEGMLSAESLKLDNIARFICEKIDGIITIENKPKKELIQMLVRRGYDSDPVKAWKESNDKLVKLDRDEEATEESQEEELEKGQPDFNYILGMALWCLTKEKKEELLRQRDSKADELYQLRKKTKEDLWLDDLNNFLTELDKVEEIERKEDKVQVVAQSKSAKGRQRQKKVSQEETRPSPMSRRVEPKIDATIMAKAQAAAKQRKKKMEKKEAADMFTDMLDEDDEDSKMSLADRVAAKQGVKKENSGLKDLSPDKPKPKAAPRKPAGTAPKREKKKSGSPKKKGKQRNPWSDSESEQSIKSDVSDDDLDSSFRSVEVAPRERGGPRRQAAAKAKYNYSDDESAPKFSDSEDDEPPPKPTITNGAGAKNDDDFTPSQSPPRNYSDDSDNDNDVPTQSTNNDDIFGSQSSNRPKSPIFSVDDSDDEPSWPPKETAPKKDPPKKDPPKKAAAPKKTKTAKESDPKQRTLLDMAKPKAQPKPKPKDKFSNEDDSDHDQLIIDTSDDGLKSVPSQSTNGKSSQSKASDKPKKAPVKRKPKFSDLSDLSDDDKPKPKKAAPKKRAPAKKKVDSDMSDDGFGAKPPAKKGRKKKGSDDEDDWDTLVAPKKKSTAAKKKKPTFDSDEDDMDVGVDVAPRERGGGRARKAVKYNFGGDSDSDDDFC